MILGCFYGYGFHCNPLSLFGEKIHSKYTGSRHPRAAGIHQPQKQKLDSRYARMTMCHQLNSAFSSIYADPAYADIHLPVPLAAVP